MRSGRFRARWPGGLLGCPRAGLFGLVGKLDPLLREREPHSLADLVYCRVCPSPALLCGEAAACRKVLRVLDRTHWTVSAPVSRASESPRALSLARFAAWDLRFCARTFSRLASRYLRLVSRVLPRFAFRHFWLASRTFSRLAARHLRRPSRRFSGSLYNTYPRGAVDGFQVPQAATQRRLDRPVPSP
jgi:hypothetical protein